MIKTEERRQNKIKDEFKSNCLVYTCTFAKLEASPIVTDKTKMLLSSSCGPIS